MSESSDPDPPTSRRRSSRRWLGLFGFLAVLLLFLCAVGLYVLRERAAPAAPPAAVGAWFQVYFTAPVYPDDPNKHQGGIDTKLVALMDQAQKTLDVADYDFDLADVADAMVRAKGRGVTVRMVT